MKRPPDADQRLIERFCDNAWLTDGLARNSLESYRRDLMQFATWLASPDAQAVASIAQATSADIHRYLAWQVSSRKAKPALS